MALVQGQFLPLKLMQIGQTKCPPTRQTMENDIFQFYESSADAAPGKGAGETLHSPPEKYAELRKIKGWRRILGTDAANTILPLTKDAELWQGKGKAKTRCLVLEAQRTSLEQPTEGWGMEEKPVVVPDKKKNKKNNSNKNNVGAIPEGALASQGETALEAAEAVEAVPDSEAVTDRQDSAIRFCPVCRYYMYLEVSGEDQSLQRLCRNCGHREEDTKGGMVMEMMVQERSAEGYKILLNEFTRQDPRLPHIRKNIKCPEPTCDSNHGTKDPDIIYIKYDAVNMLYLYICDICGFQWRSAR